MDRLVLASQSPRRLALCRQIGLLPEVVKPGIDETQLPGESASDLVLRLSMEKANVVADADEGAVVIAGDSVVCVDLDVFGKPVDATDARRMLEKLSGRTHSVLSGLVVRSKSDVFSCVEETKVSMVELAAETIESYLATDEWQDRAGAFSIQGRAGAFVDGIEGSHSNVVGLPVHKLFKGLVKVGYRNQAFWGLASDA